MENFNQSSGRSLNSSETELVDKLTTTTTAAHHFNSSSQHYHSCRHASQRPPDPPRRRHKKTKSLTDGVLVATSTASDSNLLNRTTITTTKVGSKREADVTAEDYGLNSTRRKFSSQQSLTPTTPTKTTPTKTFLNTSKSTTAAADDSTRLKRAEQDKSDGEKERTAQPIDKQNSDVVNQQQRGDSDEEASESEKSLATASVDFQDARNDMDDVTEGCGDVEEEAAVDGRRQKPPSTLNVARGGVGGNNVDSLLSTSSPSNSPFTKESFEPFGSSKLKEDEKVKVGESNSAVAVGGNNKRTQSSRKKKRTSASWYNVLSPSYRSKNEHFHKFFKTVPESERLLFDASCALVNDILVQGRLYISQNYVCFHSNFLKWQKAVVISFASCSKITKERLAKIFPNSICFHQSSANHKHLFTSFTSRDRAFSQIHKLWLASKNQTPMTSQQIWDNVREQYGSDLGCSSDSDYVKADSDDQNRKRKKKMSKKKNKASNERLAESSSKQSAAAASQATAASAANATTPLEVDNNINNNSWSIADDSEQASADDMSLGSEERTSSPNSFLGAFSTKFHDTDPSPCEHVVGDLNQVYLDERYNHVTSAQLFNVLFGDNNAFYRDYLTQKGVTNMSNTKWIRTEDGSSEEGSRKRSFDYVMPLNHPLGPKSSRIVEEQVLHNRSEPGRTYGVDIVTQNYDIPYADYFQTILRYSIRKINPTTTELRVSAGIKFLKDPWGMVKNFIEKNAYAGIDDNFKQLGRHLADHLARNFRPPPPPAISSSSSMATTNNNNTATPTPSKPTATTTTKKPSKTKSKKADCERVESVKEVPAHPEQLTAGKSEAVSVSSTYSIIVSRLPSIPRLLLPSLLTLLLITLLYNNYSMNRRLVELERIVVDNSLERDDLHHSSSGWVRRGEDSCALVEQVVSRLERIESALLEWRRVSEERWEEQK